MARRSSSSLIREEDGCLLAENLVPWGRGMRVAADLGLELQGSFRSSMAQARGFHDDPGSSFRAPSGAAWLKHRASMMALAQASGLLSEQHGSSTGLP